MVAKLGGRLFLAFQVPAYRWLWFSSFMGANGFTSYALAQGWLILELTNSPLMVGLAPALGGAANLVFSPFGGVLADRLNRRSVLMACQGVSATISLTLGLLTISGHIQVWHILAVSVVSGLNMALQFPTRNNLMYDLVGRSMVMNAMAAQFTAFHGASILGPFAAGFLMAAFGPGPVFLGVSAFLYTSALLLLRLPSLAGRASSSGSFWQDFREGLGFALHDRAIRTVMWVILFTETLGYSSRSMFPVVARDVLGAGPVALGLMNTAWGMGGLVTAIALSSSRYIRAKGKVLLVAALGFGVLLLSFALSRNLPLSLSLLFLAGGFGVTYDTMATTLLQTLPPDNMRGRVMGLYGVLLSGFSLGALAMGAVAKAWGVTTAIAGGGGIVALNALRVAPAARLLGERSGDESKAELASVQGPGDRTIPGR